MTDNLQYEIPLGKIFNSLSTNDKAYFYHLRREYTDENMDTKTMFTRICEKFNRNPDDYTPVPLTVVEDDDTPLEEPFPNAVEQKHLDTNEAFWRGVPPELYDDYSLVPNHLRTEFLKMVVIIKNKAGDNYGAFIDTCKAYSVFYREVRDNLSDDDKTRGETFIENNTEFLPTDDRDWITDLTIERKIRYIFGTKFSTITN